MAVRRRAVPAADAPSATTTSLRHAMTIDSDTRRRWGVAVLVTVARPAQARGESQLLG